MAFTPDGKRIFAVDKQKKGLAWSVADGKPAETDHPPDFTLPGPSRSPDGSLRASINFDTVTIKKTQRERENLWPLPNAAERRRYHTEQADLAEKEKKWFAAAFHLNRLLLDAPDDIEVKRRRDDALHHYAAAPAKSQPMEKAP